MNQNIDIVEWKSNIPQVKQNFYFHSLIQSTDNTQHYIVEDIQDFLNQKAQKNQVIFYLKQIFFTDKNEFEYQKNYYDNFLNYCKDLNHRRKDVCKLLQIFTNSQEEIQKYEIILIMEFGEVDRIDIEQIQNAHINKFLKNIAALLIDLKTHSDLSHGNIKIDNIILIDNILKISGFKPIYTKKNIKGWKEEITIEHGKYRLDLFQLGLLWLKFKNFSLDEITEQNNSLDFVFKNIKSKYLDNIDLMNDIDGKEILVKLLDIVNYPKFDLDQLQLQFNTILILQDINNDLEEDQFDLNPFKESLKSEYQQSSFQNESIKLEKKEYNQEFNQKNGSFGNFKKAPKDELISIQDFNDSQQLNLEENAQKNVDKNERMSANPTKEQKIIISSQVNSEKQIESFKDKIYSIKQSVSFKNNNNYGQQNYLRIQESQKDSLVNISDDNQNEKQIEVKKISFKNDSSGKFQLKHQSSNQDNQVNNKKEENNIKEKNQLQNQSKQNKTEELKQYFGKNKKTEKIQHEPKTIIEENKEPKQEFLNKQNEIQTNISKETINNQKILNNKNQQQFEEEFIEIQRDFKKINIVEYDEKNKQNQMETLNDQTEKDQQDTNEKKNQIQKEDSEKNNRLDQLINKKVKSKNQNLKKKSKSITKKEQYYNTQKSQKDENIRQTYKDIYTKNKKGNHKQSLKKQKNKNYTNFNSKPKSKQSGYKLQYNKMQKNTKEKSLDEKLDKVLKKHNQQMLKTKRIIQKDEKLDKSLEKIKNQNPKKVNQTTSQQNIDEQDKQIQKRFKELISKTKVSNIQDKEHYETQKQNLEQINQKLFASNPVQKNFNLPLVLKKKEIQNDFKSIKPMKNKKIPSIPFEQNPLVCGLPNIKNKNKLDKSSFDIKFDISLNKSQNYDSYIDCRYKSNNYRSQSKNKTDNILEGIYEKQNTFGNQTLNFSLDNSFINTAQDPNKTIENIMNNFEEKNQSISKISKNQKQKKNSIFDLDEVQNLMNKSLNKNKTPQEDQSQAEIKNKSMTQEINKSQNKKTLKEELNNDEFNELQFGKDYQEKMKTLAVLLKNKNLQQAIELLFFVLQTEIGQAKVDAYKTLGILFCYTKQLDKAVEYTLRGVEYLDQQKLEEKYTQNKIALLMNLAIIYSTRSEYNKCLDVLMDEIFENEENQPIAYMTILGDCHYAMKNYLNAFDAYKEQIERIGQLLINKEVYLNFILLCKKSVACLIEGKEFNFYPEFLKFIIKSAQRYIKTQETYEGKVKFEKLQDKLLCAILHVIWSKKNIQFMAHTMKYQKSKNLINLKNLSPKEIKILVGDILSYTLNLKKNKSFKKFRDDFYLANQFILEAINSTQNQNPLLKQKVIVLFNLGIFLIQERNFKLAQVSHQECLDILNKQPIQNEEQIFVILYNIGLSMYKMNDEQNCIYYLEQIFQRRSSNVKILSQALHLLILSYFKTSQYEKIIEYFDSDLAVKYHISENTNYEHFQIMIFLYFFATFRIRSENLKKKLLFYKNKLDDDKKQLLIHIILANGKLMLNYFREKNLKVNIPLQEKLSNLLLNDKQDYNSLIRFVKDFYFQNVEQVQIGQCLQQYGIKVQSSFIACFILQISNLLNFVCDKEFTIDQKRKLIEFVNSLDKNEEFKSNIFALSLDYNPSQQQKHDLGFINKQIDKVKKKPNFEKTQKQQQSQNQIIKKTNVKVQQPKLKNIQKPKTAKTQLNLKNDQNVNLNQETKLNEMYDKLWFCSSQKDLDKLKLHIQDKNKQSLDTPNNKQILINLILQNELKINDKKIQSLIKRLKLKKEKQVDCIQIFQLLILSKNNNSLKLFLEKCEKENTQLFQHLIQILNDKFLQHFNNILSSIKKQTFDGDEFYTENSVFYHLLPSQIQKQKNQSSNKNDISILFISFYHFLKLKTFNFIKKHINSFLLQKYKIFNIFQQFFLENNENEIILIKKILKIITDQDQQEFSQNLFFLYYLLSHTQSKNLSEIQLNEELLNLIKTKSLNQNDIYNFVILTSFIGNIYFRNKLWMSSNKMKQISFEGFKKLNVGNLKTLKDLEFPLYSKEFILFQIFSYWYMNEHKLQSNELSEKCLESLEKFEIEENELKKQFQVLKLFNKKFKNLKIEENDLVNLDEKNNTEQVLQNVQAQLVK